MPIESCWLTNQTGAIIRFRTSQLAHLPPKDADLHIETFDGRIISGYCPNGVLLTPGR